MKQSYSYQFCVNPKPVGFRQVLARLVRRAADWVDGCESFTVFMSADPYVSKVERRKCLEKGFVRAEQLLADVVRLNAVEVAAGRERPDMFGVSDER